MSSSNKEGNLVWIDLEMTGLDPDNDRIIEIATIVTDAHLNVLAEGPVFAIHQKDMVLNAMDEWNTRQHGNSGLVGRVRRSKIDETEAEAQTIEFLSRFVDWFSSRHICFLLHHTGEKTAVSFVTTRAQTSCTRRTAPVRSISRAACWKMPVSTRLLPPTIMESLCTTRMFM